MLSFFEEYVKTICMVVIISAFAEIIIPDNGFRNYIRFITGLVMTIVIAMPAVSFFTSGSFNKIDLKGFLSMPDDAAVMIDEAYYARTKEKLAEDIYIASLEEEVREGLTAFGEKVIRAEAEKEGESFFLEIELESGRESEKEQLYDSVLKKYGIKEENIKIKYK